MGILRSSFTIAGNGCRFRSSSVAIAVYSISYPVIIIFPGGLFFAKIPYTLVLLEINTILPCPAVISLMSPIYWRISTALSSFHQIYDIDNGVRWRITSCALPRSALSHEKRFVPPQLAGLLLSFSISCSAFSIGDS